MIFSKAVFVMLIRVINSDMISKPIFDLTSGKEAIVSKSLQANVERCFYKCFLDGKAFQKAHP